MVAYCGGDGPLGDVRVPGQSVLGSLCDRGVPHPGDTAYLHLEVVGNDAHASDALDGVGGGALLGPAIDDARQGDRATADCDADVRGVHGVVPVQLGEDVLLKLVVIDACPGFGGLVRVGLDLGGCHVHIPFVRWSRPARRSESGPRPVLQHPHSAVRRPGAKVPARWCRTPMAGFVALNDRKCAVDPSRRTASPSSIGAGNTAASFVVSSMWAYGLAVVGFNVARSDRCAPSGRYGTRSLCGRGCRPRG